MRRLLLPALLFPALLPACREIGGPSGGQPFAAVVRLEPDTYAVTVGAPATFTAVVTARDGRPVPGARVTWSTFYLLYTHISSIPPDTVWIHPLDPASTTTDATGRASVAYTAPVSGWGQDAVARLENGPADTAVIVASPPTLSTVNAAWSDLAPMPFKRGGMAAVVHGERIFLLGGFCKDSGFSPSGDCGSYVGTNLDSVRFVLMALTPGTGQWEQIAVPDSLQPRYWYTGVLGLDVGPDHNVQPGADLSDGIHLFAAGRHLRYQPESARWSALAPPWPDSLPRPALAAVVQDRLYVVSDAGALRIYDSAGDRWSDGAAMPRAPGSPGRNGPAAAVLNGQIYVAGGGGLFGDGRELTRYDPAANTWSALPPMPYGRSNMAAGVLAGRFCVFGGGEGYWIGSAPFVETYCYDPQQNAWLLGPARDLFIAGGAAVTFGNAVYVFGGGYTVYKMGWFASDSVKLLAPR